MILPVITVRAFPSSHSSDPLNQSPKMMVRLEVSGLEYVDEFRISDESLFLGGTFDLIWKELGIRMKTAIAERWSHS